MKALLIALLGLSILSLTACNTVAGAARTSRPLAKRSKTPPTDETEVTGVGRILSERPGFSDAFVERDPS